jgi:hypothetical protein
LSGGDIAAQFDGSHFNPKVTKVEMYVPANGARGAILAEKIQVLQGKASARITTKHDIRSRENTDLVAVGD